MLLAFHQVRNPAFALSPCTACTFKVPLHTAVAGDDCEGGGVCCPVQGEVASGWGKVRGASARGRALTVIALIGLLRTSICATSHCSASYLGLCSVNLDLRLPSPTSPDPPACCRASLPRPCA